MPIQADADALEKNHGGRGVLLGGVSGVVSASVMIIGGGIVGFNAVQMTVGLQADVTILDANAHMVEKFSNYFGAKVRILHSNDNILKAHIIRSDLIIGGILIAGAKAPKVINKTILPFIKRGSILVDIDINQGGYFETFHATTHANPIYVIDGVMHYCVANMPGAVPIASTYALNNTTLSGLLAIANQGWKKALSNDKYLLNGLMFAKERLLIKLLPMICDTNIPKQTHCLRLRKDNGNRVYLYYLHITFFYLACFTTILRYKF